MLMNVICKGNDPKVRLTSCGVTYTSKNCRSTRTDQVPLYQDRPKHP